MRAKEDGVKLQLVNTGEAELEVKEADSFLPGNILITQLQRMNQRTVKSQMQQNVKILVHLSKRSPSDFL